MNQEKPKLISDMKHTEQVETGCCLRSCGGVPHHLGKKKSEDVIIEVLSKAKNELKENL